MSLFRMYAYLDPNPESVPEAGMSYANNPLRYCGVYAISLRQDGQSPSVDQVYSLDKIY